MVNIDCPNDDAANCCGICGVKVIAVVPVRGRLPLLKHTIERLIHKNGVYKVICVGDGNEERKVCEAAGAEWLQYRNRPLGAKWNAGFIRAGKYDPDACLFVGSSDWLSDNWLPELIPVLRNADMVGLPGCYFLDIGDTLRLCFWRGYMGPRQGESIGIGRLISGAMLKRLNWQPFESMLDNSMDGSMQNKIIKAGGKIITVDNARVKSVSISTDRWPNKHKFEDHYLGKYPSEKIKDVDQWVNDYFQEAKKVFE